MHSRASHKEPTKDTELSKLRGTAWLSSAVSTSGLEFDAFAQKYVDRGRSASGLARKWQTGKINPTRHSALMVDRLLPGTLCIFDLVLWGLLSDAPIKTSAVEKIISTYSAGDSWKFPENERLRPCKRQIVVDINDTQRLVYRGDFWGFVGALALVRFYEGTGNCLQHCSASRDMFRALPGALKEPWLRPLANDLVARLRRLQRRSPYASMMFDVDEEVILRQADDADFEPHREWRRRDPRTFRFVEIEDPVLQSIVVPGAAVEGLADPVGVISSVCQFAPRKTMPN